MIHQFIQPSPHLKAFVKDYFILHFKVENSMPALIKPFPATPIHSLVFYVKGRINAYDPKANTVQKFPKIAINGQQVSRFDFHVPHEYLMFSINFQPCALSKFLRLPLVEFVDKRIDAEAILNPHIQNVHEQLEYAQDYLSMVKTVEQYLWQRIQSLKTDRQPIDEVSCLMLDQKQYIPVERWAQWACLSVSQFERRFVQQMGISPKLFLRINRFHKAFEMKDQNPELEWLNIAHDLDYSDYQHLVKDFKQFSGSTPKTLLQEAAFAPEKILHFKSPTSSLLKPK
jgi:AraC-like DNA-binding protein